LSFWLQGSFQGSNGIACFGGLIKSNEAVDQLENK